MATPKTSAWQDRIEEFRSIVDSAEAFKAQAADSPIVKVGKLGKAFAEALSGSYMLDSVTDEQRAEMLALHELVTTVSGTLAPTVADNSEGNALAERIAKVLRLDPEDYPNGFDKVADDAKALSERWTASTVTTRKARTPRADGEAPADNASQFLATHGVGSVEMTFAMPADATNPKTDKAFPVSITRGSTFSDLSNEINIRAKALGDTGNAPTGQREQFKAFRTAITGGDSSVGDEWTVTRPTPKGDIVVTMKRVA